MKRFVILYLLIIAGLNTFAINFSQAQVKDSLLRVLSKQPHDTSRLMTLHALAKLDQTSLTFIYYEDLLLKEAILQNNIQYQCQAMHDHIIYYYNHNDKKRVQQWMGRLSKIAPKHGYWDIYFKAKRWEIELYFLREELELGLYEAKKLEAEAIQQNNKQGQAVANLCLLSGYIGTLQLDKAMQASDKAHKLLSPKDDALTRINVLMRIVAVYSFFEKDDKLIVALVEMKKAYDEINPALQSSYSNILMSIEAQYVHYYLRKNNLEQARIHRDNMEKYFSTDFYLPSVIDRLNACAEFYKYNKEYDKALAIRDTLILNIKDIFPSEVIYQNVKIADILIDAGRMSDALPYYKRAVIQTDSMVASVSRKQIKQIQEIYNVDKLLLEKEQLKFYIQITALTVIGILIFLSIVFTLRFYQSRNKLKLAEQETRKATRITEEANEVKSRFLSNMSFNVRIPLNNVVGFSQLIATDPNIDEETLHEYALIIQKNSNELIQLVNDVLDLSRLEANMMRFNMTEYGIIDLCNDAISQVHMKNYLIQTSFITDQQNELIYLDVSRFSQVLISLMMYPESCELPRKIVFKLYEKKGVYTFKFHNSPLADPTFSTQTVAVRHEINRLTMEHFGGKYEVNAQEVEGPTVYFTIPKAETPKLTD